MVLHQPVCTMHERWSSARLESFNPEIPVCPVPGLPAVEPERSSWWSSWCHESGQADKLYGSKAGEKS